MTSLTPDLLAWAGSSADRRHRILGATPTWSRAVTARFVLHFNQATGSIVTATNAPSESYDAFYLLAYAAYAAGKEPLSGTTLARAIMHLIPPGPRVEVGPAQIFDAFAALRRGERIDLDGAGGSLDFDLATGEAAVDQAIVCPGVDVHGGASGVVDSGLTYRSAEQRLVGELRCP